MSKTGQKQQAKASGLDSAIETSLKRMAQVGADKVSRKLAEGLVNYENAPSLAERLASGGLTKTTGRGTLKPRAASKSAEAKGSATVPQTIDAHVSMLTVPGSANAILNGGAHLTMGGAPNVMGLGTGCRIAMSFKGMDLGTDGKTNLSSGAAAWIPADQTDTPNPGVYLNPTHDDTLISPASFDSAGGVVGVGILRPMCNGVNRAARFCRNFLRWRIRFCAIDLIGLMGTTQTGAIRLAKTDDVLSAAELNWGSEAKSPASAAFAWVANQQTGLQVPLWTPTARFVAIDERSRKNGDKFRRMAPADLFYSRMSQAEGRGIPQAADADGEIGQLALRNMSQGVVFAAQTLGHDSSSTYCTPRMQTYWHVVVDLYGLDLATPVDNNLQIAHRQVFRGDERSIQQTGVEALMKLRGTVDEARRPEKSDGQRSSCRPPLTVTEGERKSDGSEETELKQLVPANLARSSKDGWVLANTPKLQSSDPASLAGLRLVSRP